MLLIRRIAARRQRSKVRTVCAYCIDDVVPVLLAPYKCDVIGGRKVDPIDVAYMALRVHIGEISDERQNQNKADKDSLEKPLSLPVPPAMGCCLLHGYPSSAAMTFGVSVRSSYGSYARRRSCRLHTPQRNPGP